MVRARVSSSDSLFDQSPGLPVLVSKLESGCTSLNSATTLSGLPAVQRLCFLLCADQMSIDTAYMHTKCNKLHCQPLSALCPRILKGVLSNIEGIGRQTSVVARSCSHNLVCEESSASDASPHTNPRLRFDDLQTRGWQI